MYSVGLYALALLYINFLLLFEYCFIFSTSLVQYQIILIFATIAQRAYLRNSMQIYIFLWLQKTPKNNRCIEKMHTITPVSPKYSNPSSYCCQLISAPPTKAPDPAYIVPHTTRTSKEILKYLTTISPRIS